jgi:hypothetical protein
MANDKNLAQLTNQEAILEEINEDELEGVVGGGLLSGLVFPVFNLLATVVVAVEDLLVPPAQP